MRGRTPPARRPLARTPCRDRHAVNQQVSGLEHGRSRWGPGFRGHPSPNYCISGRKARLRKGLLRSVWLRHPTPTRGPSLSPNQHKMPGHSIFAPLLLKSVVVGGGPGPDVSLEPGHHPADGAVPGSVPLRSPSCREPAVLAAIVACWRRDEEASLYHVIAKHRRNLRILDIEDFRYRNPWVVPGGSMCHSLAGDHPYFIDQGPLLTSRGP